MLWSSPASFHLANTNAQSIVVLRTTTVRHYSYFVMFGGTAMARLREVFFQLILRKSQGKNDNPHKLFNRV